MDEVFTRLSDNAVLDFSNKTKLYSAPGVYGTTKTREFSYGVFGKAVNLSSTIDQKVFTLAFVSGDGTGTDIKKIERFFALSDGLFRVNANNTFGFTLDFYVNSTEADVFEGNSTIVLTCTALYGDFVEEEIAEIYSGTIAAGGNFTQISRAYTNSFSESVSIRFSITAPSTVTFNQGIGVLIRKGTSSTAPQVSTTTGDKDENGTRINFTGLRYAVDSWDEVVDGFGTVNPGSSTFFKVKPGESTTIVVPAFSKPITTNVALTAKIEAVVLKQKQIL